MDEDPHPGLPRRRLNWTARPTDPLAWHALFASNAGMSKCLNCGRHTILLSVEEAGEAFCSERCCKAFPLLQWTSVRPEDTYRRAMEIRNAACPCCGQPGPLDAHNVYRVWSAVVYSAWGTRSVVCCRKCGREEQFAAAMLSLALGWWGLPLGPLLTPIQVIRNLLAMRRPTPPSPSAELLRAARKDLALRIGQTKPQATALPLPAPLGYIAMPAAPAKTE